MTIERNLPIPNHPMRKFNWSDLDIGDSFLVPAPVTVEHMSSLATRRGKATGRRYTCRTIKNGNGVAEGVRVWRIA